MERLMSLLIQCVIHTSASVHLNLGMFLFVYFILLFFLVFLCFCIVSVHCISHGTVWHVSGRNWPFAVYSINSIEGSYRNFAVAMIHRTTVNFAASDRRLRRWQRGCGAPSQPELAGTNQ